MRMLVVHVGPPLVHPHDPRALKERLVRSNWSRWSNQSSKLMKGTFNPARRKPVDRVPAAVVQKEDARRDGGPRGPRWKC